MKKCISVSGLILLVCLGVLYLWPGAATYAQENTQSQLFLPSVVAGSSSETVASGGVGELLDVEEENEIRMLLPLVLNSMRDDNGVMADSEDSLTITISNTPVIWPGTAWEVVTPEAAGMDSILLAQARDYALRGGGSGYIVRYGRLVMSWGSATQRYDVKSLTKSIGGTALGLAIIDRKLTLNTLVQPSHPALGSPPDKNLLTGWTDDITFKHLASHSAGFGKGGGYNALLFAPGTQWSYSDGGPNWLAEALTLSYREDMYTLLTRRVFTPLRIPSGQIAWRNNLYRPDTIEGIKRREFGAGISTSVNALARIGYLYLRNGVWENTRIIPEGFIRQLRVTPSDIRGLPVNDTASYFNASRHYGLLWWNNADLTLANVPRDAYWGWGLGDNLLLVIPSLDIVVARTGSGWRTGWNADYGVLQPFFEPIARSVIQ